MWRKYKNKSKLSQITKYAIDLNTRSIKLLDKWANIVVYYEKEIGYNHFQNLINLAKKGDGIQRYIDSNNLDSLTDDIIE